MLVADGSELVGLVVGRLPLAVVVTVELPVGGQLAVQLVVAVGRLADVLFVVGGTGLVVPVTVVVPVGGQMIVAEAGELSVAAVVVVGCQFQYQLNSLHKAGCRNWLIR